MILAIDPGTTESAWAYIDDGTLQDSQKISNNAMLGVIRQMLPFADAIVIEMVACYGMPVGAEVFLNCVWIGRFVEAADGDAHLLTRVEVKQHLCHKTVGVNDSVIRQRLIDKFGPGKEKAIGTKKNPGPLYGVKGDEWAALALGVTYMETRGGE